MTPIFFAFSLAFVKQEKQKLQNSFISCFITNTTTSNTTTTHNNNYKNKELETLMVTVRIHSQDIGMEFDIEKCSMLIMKSRQMTEGIELPNQENIGTLRETES